MKVQNCIYGGKASIPKKCFEDEDLRYVRCHDCGEESLSWNNGNHAIINWNSLIKILRSEKLAIDMIEYCDKNTCWEPRCKYKKYCDNYKHTPVYYNVSELAKEIRKITKQ